MCIPSKCAPCPNVYHKNVHPVRMYIRRIYIIVHSIYISMHILYTFLYTFDIYSIYIPCIFYIHSMHSILHHSFVLLCTFPGKVLVDTFVYRRAVCHIYGTLRGRLQGANPRADAHSQEQILSVEEEKAIVQLCVTLDDWGHPLRGSLVKDFAMSLLPQARRRQLGNHWLTLPESKSRNSIEV